MTFTIGHDLSLVYQRTHCSHSCIIIIIIIIIIYVFIFLCWCCRILIAAPDVRVAFCSTAERSAG
jgi:hypothetical protein